MALTRKMLKAMGIEEDKIEQIIEAHIEATDALKEDRDKFKNSASRLKEVEKELNDLKDNSFEEKYNDIKKQFDEYKENEKAQSIKKAKETAYKKVLEDIGISEKRINSVLKVSDINNINLDKDGNIKEVDTLKETLKEEWSDFIVTKEVKGANTSNPPSNTGGKMTKDDIMKIKDTTERQQAMIENHELFGF